MKNLFTETVFLEKFLDVFVDERRLEGMGIPIRNSSNYLVENLKTFLEQFMEKFQ